MNELTKISLALIMLSIISGVTGFISTSQAAATPKSVTTALQQIIPGIEPDKVIESPIAGLYEARYGTNILYLTSDGRYLIQGDLFDTSTQTNLSEIKRAAVRITSINSIDSASLIIFKPEKTRHVVTIFTDIDCGYCRKMHREMADYLQQGIEIRYAAYPRSGANTESYYKAVTAWCADDRQQALTKAKAGQDLPTIKCPSHPVDQHMKIANDLGITGTPTLVLADGSILPGYVPAARLRQYLDSL